MITFLLGQVVPMLQSIPRLIQGSGPCKFKSKYVQVFCVAPLKVQRAATRQQKVIQRAVVYKNAGDYPFLSVQTESLFSRAVYKPIAYVISPVLFTHFCFLPKSCTTFLSQLWTFPISGLVFSAKKGVGFFISGQVYIITYVHIKYVVQGCEKAATTSDASYTDLHWCGQYSVGLGSI